MAAGLSLRGRLEADPTGAGGAAGCGQKANFATCELRRAEAVGAHPHRWRIIDTEGMKI